RHRHRRDAHGARSLRPRVRARRHHARMARRRPGRTGRRCAQRPRARRDRSALPAADRSRPAARRRDEGAGEARLGAGDAVRGAGAADGRQRPPSRRRRGRSPRRARPPRHGVRRNERVIPMPDFWRDHRVLLTGGGGFLGSFIRERLQPRAAEVLAPRASELDLRDGEAVRAYLREHRPTLVIHAAAVVGGIGANQREPGRFFYENTIMGVQLIEEARRANVVKLVCLGTICSYPKFAPIPFREEDMWNGYPEETTATYGIAKKALLVQLQSYREHYGFDGVFVMPVN